MVVLRPLLQEDIKEAMKLSSAEGWNQTEKDWEFIIGQPQNICVAAISDKKIVGTSVAVNYNNDVAWIGMVLVDKDYRGKGISKLLLTNLFDQLKHCKSIKLDAMPAGQPVYQKFGFKNELIIYRMVRISSSIKSMHLKIEPHPVPPLAHEISEIAQFDANVFGANRLSLINFLYEKFPNMSVLLRQNNQINGFALGRVGSRFHQIGPVSAISTEDAKVLISKSTETIGKKDIVIDILDNKIELIEWLESIGFIKRRHFVRMYKNENTSPGLIHNQYLICGPEFG